MYALLLSHPKTEIIFLSVLQQMLAILSPTPFLLPIILGLIHVLGLPHHVTGVLVIQISHHILGEDICFVVSSANKHNLDESILNELSIKMVSYNHMLSSGACAHVFSHENCSNIVNSNNHGHLHLNTNGKQNLDYELDLLCSLR